MKKPLTAFIIVSCFILTPVVHAQSYQTFSRELNTIIERARFRIGPFRIYPSIVLREVGYDDNVYRQREDEDTVSDYTAIFSPRVNTYLLVRNFLILSFYENPEYIYFSDQSSERRWNNTWAPEFKFLFMHRFVLSGSYLNSDRRFRATSELDFRVNELRESYRGSIFYETARETSIGLSAAVNKISYEDVALPDQEIDLSRLLNREERVFNSEIYYQLSPDRFFFVQGGYSDYIFASQESRFKDSYSYHLLSGIRFPLLGSIRGTAALGLRHFSPRTWGKKGFFGLIGNTSVELRIRRFIFRVLYNRDLRFSFWTENIFYLEDRYGGGASFYPTRFFRLDYNFSYGDGVYPEPFFRRLPDETYSELKRKDTYFMHTFGVAFRLIRNIGLGINFNFWQRESNFYAAQRKNMFIGGYVTYDF